MLSRSVANLVVHRSAIPSMELPLIIMSFRLIPVHVLLPFLLHIPLPVGLVLVLEDVESLLLLVRVLSLFVVIVVLVRL